MDALPDGIVPEDSQSDLCYLCLLPLEGNRDGAYPIAVTVHSQAAGSLFLEQKVVEVCKRCHLAVLLNHEHYHARAPLGCALN